MKHRVYCISKYTTEDFDENGVYTKKEWTSKYDIGSVYENQVFDIEEYMLMEDKYVLTIGYLLEEYGITELVVSELEWYTSPKEEENERIKNAKIEECISKIGEGTILNEDQIEFVCRAMLREYVWCKLYSKQKHFILSVGYDFYIRLICEELTKEQKSKILSFGLFVEEK